MSTPFPFEERAQQDRIEPRTDPWAGPARPHWYAGLGFNEDTAYLGPFYRALEAAGSGAAKGLTVANGAWHGVWSPLADIAEERGTLGASLIRGLEQRTAAKQAETRDMVRAMTPDAATTGVATQLLHGVGEGAYLMSTGALAGPGGAAALVGTTEGGSRYQELKEQGVGTGTAATSGAVTAITSAAGALLPAAYGSTLATRLLTGAAGNTAFGVASRAADHAILQAGGYPEMAEQQKIWDSTQMLVDAALGATFGGIHHVHASAETRAVLRTPENEDAALAVNLALRDRQAAPGVAVNPESANAHQAALEKAQTDLLQGKPVDVSDSGLERAQFLERSERDLSPESQIMLDVFKESGLLDEEANLKDLEDQFERRRSGEKEPVKSAEPAASNFLTEFERAHPENPNEPTQRVMEGAKVELQRDPFDESAVHINSLEADETGKGAGRAALKEVTDLADKHGVRLTLDAKPFGEKAMESEKLARFYKRFGFEVKEQGEGHALMERTPGAPKNPRTGKPFEYTHQVDAEIARSEQEQVKRAGLLESPEKLQLYAVERGETSASMRSLLEENRTNTDALLSDLRIVKQSEWYSGRKATEAVKSSLIQFKDITSDPDKQALADRPNLMITENGRPVKASDAMEAAKPETDWFTATTAATNCFARRGA